jgi:hypothetical protein
MTVHVRMAKAANSLDNDGLAELPTSGASRIAKDKRKHATSAKGSSWGPDESNRSGWGQ